MNMMEKTDASKREDAPNVEARVLDEYEKEKTNSLEREEVLEKDLFKRKRLM